MPSAASLQSPILLARELMTLCHCTSNEQLNYYGTMMVQ